MTLSAEFVLQFAMHLEIDLLYSGDDAVASSARQSSVPNNGNLGSGPGSLHSNSEASDSRTVVAAVGSRSVGLTRTVYCTVGVVLHIK